MSELPADFGAIPVDHPRARVRTSVAGTSEAEEAVLLARIPRRAEVKKGATIEVTYAGEPQFAAIQGTSMSYATNTSFDVIRAGDLYYTCFRGAWFVSTTPLGPWHVTQFDSGCGPATWLHGTGLPSEPRTSMPLIMQVSAAELSYFT